MTPELGTDTGYMYETIDINIVPDLYVTWIVDIWSGDRNDPATDVNRYIAVWNADALEDEQGNAVDPVFHRRSSYSTEPKPNIQPLHWHLLDSVKAADPAARSFKQQQESALTVDPESYYGRQHKPYQDMMEAIETLVGDPENEEAWSKIEQFRRIQAMRHER